MPINSAAPVEADGNTYPHFGVAMAIAPIWNTNYVSGNMALTLTPYRITETGEVESRPDLAKHLSVGDIFQKAQSDPVFGGPMVQIYTAIQAYLTAAGV